jgi:hypothetical protein
MSKLPPGISLPNMKKQGPALVDLMRPGNGTPWEDRGNTGSVSAYLKTVGKSFTSPALLMDHIRRPETTKDSTLFAAVSAAMWAIGVLVWNWWWLNVIDPKLPVADKWELTSPMQYWLTALLEAGLVVGGIFLWLKVGARMYIAFGGSELKGASTSLISNCFAYSLGPSILAVVPIYGWILAGIFINFDLMLVGKRRLYLKGTSAIINVILIAVSVVLITVVLYFVLRFFWINYLAMGGIEKYDVPTDARHPT